MVAASLLYPSVTCQRDEVRQWVLGRVSCSLRRESLSPDKNAGLLRAEQEALHSLPKEIRTLAERVELLSDKAEACKAAVETATAEADLHLRKQIHRVTRSRTRPLSVCLVYLSPLSFLSASSSAYLRLLPVITCVAQHPSLRPASCLALVSTFSTHFRHVTESFHKELASRLT